MGPNGVLVLGLIFMHAVHPSNSSRNVDLTMRNPPFQYNMRGELTWKLTLNTIYPRWNLFLQIMGE